MVNPEKPGAFSDVVAKFAHAKRLDIEDTEYGMGIEDKEVLRRQLEERYLREVYAPRLELWNTFNEFLKATEPTWTNPLILNPKKPRGVFDHSDEKNHYQDRLSVAKWQFDDISPDQQVKTEVTVHGLQVFDDYNRRDLAKDLPQTHLGTFVLGRNQTIREKYLADRIQAINAYTITATVHNLGADEHKTIYFYGQDGGYDTFAPIKTLKDTQNTYTSIEATLGGRSYRTRSDHFSGTFSSPIETPIELKDRFAPKYKPGEETDLEGTFRSYAYLFDQKPCALILGELDITDGNELFKYSGDETLAYMQAAALFEQIQASTLVKPVSA